MAECPKCGEKISRTHRHFWEKPVYSVMFRCQKCAYRAGVKHDYFRQFSRHTLCPRCGNMDVEKRRTRDRIDKLIYTPLSVLNALLGGKLYHCIFCRIQFYDIRNRQPKAVSETRATTPVS